MKRVILIILLLVIGLSTNAQQAKKPTLMILPSDNWCVMRYYTMSFNDQGRTTHIPNYQRAFQEDVELKAVISQIGEILTDLGYSFISVH